MLSQLPHFQIYGPVERLDDMALRPEVGQCCSTWLMERKSFSSGIKVPLSTGLPFWMGNSYSGCRNKKPSLQTRLLHLRIEWGVSLLEKAALKEPSRYFSQVFSITLGSCSLWSAVKAQPASPGMDQLATTRIPNLGHFLSESSSSAG